MSLGRMKGYWEADGGIVGDGWKKVLGVSWKELLEPCGEGCERLVGRGVEALQKG